MSRGVRPLRRPLRTTCPPSRSPSSARSAAASSGRPPATVRSSTPIAAASRSTESNRRPAVPSRRERGSVLMLMPAAVLVFLILGALAVDYGGVFVTHRDLANAAAAAANDAATRSIDLSLFYETGEIRLIPERAWSIAEQSLAARGLDRLDAE